MCFLSAGVLAGGQEKSLPQSSVLVEQHRTLIKESMQKLNLVGVGAAVILGDSVVWKEGFGYADKENKIPFTTQSNVCIGSVTKSFTALGIMQLHEKGLLNIDEPLVKYLPQFSINTRGADLKEMTVGSVIHHTSGLPNDIFLNAWEPAEKYTDTMSYVKKEYLAFPPQTIYHYSNIGFCLLGHAIYAVSQNDYPEYMRKNVFLPSRMMNTGFLSYDKLPHVSKAYDTDGTILLPLSRRNVPAGSMYSNIDDLVHFAQELIAIYHGKRGGLVEPETLKRMLSEQAETTLIDNRREVLGWSLLKNESGFAVLHFGSDHDSSAGLLILPEKRMASIFLVNTAGGLDLAIEGCHKILEGTGIGGEDYFIIHKSSPGQSKALAPQALRKHIGTYANARSVMECLLDHDELVLKTASSTYHLKPVSENEFVPLKILGPDKTELMSRARFLFKDLPGYHTLIWQDEAGRQEPLAYRIGRQKIDDRWKNRLGKYRLVDYEMKGKETFSQSELLVSDRGVLQLKLRYTSGEYLYNLRIEDDDALVFCGFDEVTGGDMIRFGKDKQKDVMFLYGLTMKKIE